MADAGVEIVPAGIDRQQGGDPEHDDADLRVVGQDLIARRTDDEEAEREELRRGLPFRDLADGDADLEVGEEFAQAGGRFASFALPTDSPSKASERCR